MRENGWNTFWLGKNHNVPVDELHAGAHEGRLAAAPGLRPLLRLPRRRDEPVVSDLTVDNHPIEQPYQPEEGYHLSKDLADQAIQMIRDVKAERAVAAVVHVVLPGRQPRAAPRRRRSGSTSTRAQFDDGYEAYREWVLPRMIEKGILPEGTELTPMNPMPEGTYSPARRRAAVGLALRRREAAVRAHGRGLRRLLRVHRPPGRPHRRLPRGVRPARQHDRSSTAPTTAPPARAARTARSTRTSSSTAGRTRWRRTSRMLDDLGSPNTYNHYPTGWAMAFSTPFRMFKRYSLPGRRLRPAGHPLAEGHRGEGRGAPPVPPRDRHRADDPRLLRPRVPRRR